MTSFQDISTLKAKIQRFEHDIPFAPSKDAALDMAIKAAEHAMKAMRLSDSPDTTKAMRNKSEFFLDEAQRIKSDPNWKPRIEIDVAKVAKLVEPKSSRPLPTSEQILLLKASQLNGFKFPPWTSFPKDNDFQLQVGQEPFIAAEALPPPAWYTAQERGAGPTMSSSRTIDLVQDAATDCSVVASLCALVARGERGHAKILGSMMFPYDNEEGRPQMSQNGKYALKLNFNGTYRKVDIDDRLPVSKSSRVLHVIDRHNPSLLWPALIEKAYLKVRGSYDFPGSNSGTDLWILSGWIPEQIFLQSDDTIPNNIWKRIYKSHQYGDVLVTMGTGKISNRTERAIGLAGEHDYAVLDMREVDGQKLMLVKNPWCEGMSWKGSIPRSPVDNEGEEDEEVLPSSRDLLNSDDELTPGTFWMDLNSVMQYFESIYLNWNPGLFSYRQDIHFAWDLSASSPSSKFKSFGNHQQFRMSVASPGTAWLLLNRHFKDGKENVHPSEYISLYMFDNHGAKVYLSDGAIQRGPFVDSPQTLLRLDNLEADKRYTIVPVEQDLTQATHTFTLSAFANARITIDEAPNKYRCQNVVSSSWTEETAGGNAHSPTYSQNPQFSITVAARTPIALLLETAMEQLHVHGNFKLRVDSNAATQLSLLPRQGAGRLRRAWAKAAFEGQQRILAAPIAPRRLTKLDVFVKQVQQTGVHETARMGQRRERSMIRVTLEIGKGPERRILIASSNGEYSDSSAGVRTGEIDLSPQEVGKAWLVIERMFTPADLEGEIFQVETFTDAPDTVDIGVWRRWEVD
ncbi:unnamed protein product [Aureobasidium pullulans]|nr:unnamed protein product [Aureobasidium pullulans]